MFAWQATVQDEFGNAVLLPVVTVYLEGGLTLASIYDESGVPLPNPLTGTLEGFVQFWADRGNYEIEGASGGSVTETWSVPLGDWIHPFSNRAAAEAATVPPPVDLIGVFAPDGDTLWYKRDAAGTALTTGDGSKWSPDRVATLRHFGAVGDGVTDNSIIMGTVADYCTSTGRSVDAGSGGTYMMGELSLVNRKLNLVGCAISRPTIKLIGGGNSNVLQTQQNGALYLENIIVDQNRENQTAGHGIRSGGCSAMRLKNTRIQNCVNYGIGFQAGSSRGVYFEDLEIDTTGRDGVDIKDLATSNEVIRIRGLTVSNYGIDFVNQAALDVRGPVDAIGLRVFVSGENNAVRNRQSGVQGRAGSGSVRGLVVTGDGTAGSAALDIAGDDPNFSVSDVAADGTALLVLQRVTAVGGTLSNIKGTNLTGTDSNSIGGADLVITGFQAENTASSSRIMDVESTAINFKLIGFNVRNNSVDPSAIRVVAGATNTHFAIGTVRGGNVGNLGTGTLQTGVVVL